MGRILVIFPGALGDLICLIPAIRTLAARRPGESIELMARGELAAFASGRIGITRGHSIDRREVTDLFVEGAPAGADARRFFQSFSEIVSFFACDNPEFRKSLIGVSSGHVSFHRFRPDGRRHIADLYMRELGLAGNPMNSRIDLLPDDLKSAASRLQRAGIDPGRFILMLPGSGSPSKNWPAANFVELSSKIMPRIPVVLALGPAESSIRGFFALGKNPVLDDLELSELAGIASMARYFVGNDSGVSHLAAASGCRGLVIFGKTDPERWAPRGDIKVVRHDPLDALSVTEVLLELERTRP